MALKIKHIKFKRLTIHGEKMTQVTIEEAVARAKREFLPIKGIVAVSWMNHTILFYVETPQDAAKVPPSYYGYPTMVKITGPIVTLK
jgi:hypothetical protein